VAKRARRIRQRKRTQDPILPQPFLRKAKVVGRWANRAEKFLRNEAKKRGMLWALIGFLIMLLVSLK
jgi:hypothetical protein